MNQQQGFQSTALPQTLGSGLPTNTSNNNPTTIAFSLDTGNNKIY